MQGANRYTIEPIKVTVGVSVRFFRPEFLHFREKQTGRIYPAAFVTVKRGGSTEI